MQYLDIPPAEIGIWWPPAKASKSLVEKVEIRGFTGISRVPVYQLPPGLNIHHKYLLADGHKREDAAKRNAIILPCAVYQPKEVINPKRDGLDDFEMIGRNHYESVLILYWAAQLHMEKMGAGRLPRCDREWEDILSAQLQR